MIILPNQCLLFLRKNCPFKTTIFKYYTTLLKSWWAPSKFFLRWVWTSIASCRLLI